jgi:hypothetical protein
LIGGGNDAKQHTQYQSDNGNDAKQHTQYQSDNDLPMQRELFHAASPGSDRVIPALLPAACLARKFHHYGVQPLLSLLVFDRSECSLCALAWCLINLTQQR